MAYTLDVRTVDGGTDGSVTLDDAIFGITPNVAVMHQVVTAQLAAARAGTQSTKTRAEVSGGGKKPFRQKGTGRARQGSTRAPHWVGGGVALGPKPRSYKQRTPRKMIQLALRSALSDRASEGRIMVMAEWPWSEPKTAQARIALATLELDGGRVLIVLDRSIDEAAYKAFRNLPLAQVILTGELNAYDVLCNDWIVFTKATLPGSNTEGADAVEATEGTDAKPKTAEPAAAEPAAAEPAAVEPAAAEPAAAEPAAAEPAAVEPEPAAVEPAAAAGPEPAAVEPESAEAAEPVAAEAEPKIATTEDAGDSEESK